MRSGPIDVQYANGVVDLRVTDDAQAVARDEALPRLLPRRDRPAPSRRDQTTLRNLIPTNRKRIYDVRKVIDALLDDVLELRRGFGLGIVTALARQDGKPARRDRQRPVAPRRRDRRARRRQGRALHAAVRRVRASDPVPVRHARASWSGPAAERTATVRHFARMFVTGANLTVPIGTIVLRKGYGLGAQAMAGGGFKAGLFCVGWPTSEFGGMGLEGAVRLGMRRELEAIDDPDERERAFEATVAAAYERGSGINMAAYGEIDDVIDPADSRRWIATLFGERHGRVVDAPRQAAPERRRLVRRRSSRSPRTRRAAPPRGARRGRPSRCETSSIARSSAGSSNATSRPQLLAHQVVVMLARRVGARS